MRPLRWLDIPAAALGAIGAAAALATSASPAFAQCGNFPIQLQHTVKYGIGLPNVGPVTVPLAITAYALNQCQDLELEFGAFGLSGSYNPGSNQYSFDLQGSLLGAYGTLTDMLIGPELGGVDPNPSIGANCTFYPEILHFTGGPSVYAFQIGDPGGPVFHSGQGKINYCDTVTILSGNAHTVELPYHLSATLQAAESFGNPNETRGFAQATIQVTVDGVVVVSQTESVESVSVIPEQRTISASGTIPIAVSAGATSVSIRLVADVYVEAKARSTGLFGTISGAAEAGVTLPNSFALGNFQLAGGGTLPEDMQIKSATTGMIYKQGTVTGAPAPPAAADGLVLAVAPNPAARTATLRVSVPGTAAGQLRIVDVRGRLVRRLSATTASSELELRWDGRDDEGRAVPAGVYRVVLETPRGRVVRPLVWLR